MNTWVRYIDRSFSTIKSSVLEALGTAVPELTDYSSSNLLMVIVDIFAGVAELINYYIDITARELFLPTARRFASVLKLASLANYNGRAMTSAHTTLTFTAKDASDNTIENTSAFTIPSGTLLSDTIGNTWTTQHDQVFRLDFKTTQISAYQYTSITGATLGTADGTVNQSYPLPLHYRDSSLVITMGVDTWELVESLGFSSATDKHCVVKLLEDGLVYVTFGDGVHGLIPPNGAIILGDYHSTKGIDGNASSGSITTITSSLTLPVGVDHLEVTNSDPAYGGRDVEGIEELRRAIPIALRTLNRAVTKKDYEDIAILSANIRAARVEWDCGARLKLYLVSHGGGNPPQSILTETEDFVNARSMMTIPVTAYPSGETVVRGKVSIVGRFRALASVIDTKTLAVLQDLYNPYTSKINQDIRTSDIVAAIDNIPEVDYLTLDYMYVQPYLRPSNPSAPLSYRIEVRSTSRVKTSWTVVYDPAQDSELPFFIYKEGTFLAKMAELTTLNGVGSLINITIDSTPSSINQSDLWTFDVLPYNQDVNLSDLSIPVVGPNDFIISTEQTYVSI